MSTSTNEGTSEAIVASRAVLDVSRRFIRDNAKEAIKEELRKLFTSDATIKTVAWAQRGSEYDDEGLDAGVFGPAINDFGGDRKGENFADDFYDKDWVWSPRTYQVDPRALPLKTLLDAIGEEILADLFGDQNLMIVTVVDGRVIVKGDYVGC